MNVGGWVCGVGVCVCVLWVSGWVCGCVCCNVYVKKKSANCGSIMSPSTPQQYTGGEAAFHTHAPSFKNALGTARTYLAIGFEVCCTSAVVFDGYCVYVCVCVCVCCASDSHTLTHKIGMWME